ncbi:MAG TPA: lysoplasmalogenase [Chitinophagaceae bacterium]
MNKRTWILLFSIILAVNIIGGLLKSPWIDHISKPLIVISLAAYFIFQTNTFTTPLKKWILAALFFSWAGDVLLMFQLNDSLFFLLGLSAFLIAHIFYIIFFHHVRVMENIRRNPWLLLVVVVYYAVLVSLLSPYLGEMKLPVRIYGIVISFMLMLAMHMQFIKNKQAGLWMVSGALLFVISDSVLAINKFYQSFELAGTLIMLTYGLAQLFIVEGAIQYIRKKDEEKKSVNN